MAAHTAEIPPVLLLEHAVDLHIDPRVEANIASRGGYGGLDRGLEDSERNIKQSSSQALPIPCQLNEFSGHIKVERVSVCLYYPFLGFECFIVFYYLLLI